MTRQMNVEQQKIALFEEIALLDEICGELDDDDNSKLVMVRANLIAKLNDMMPKVDFEIQHFDFHDTTVEVRPVSQRAKEYMGVGVVGAQIRKSQLLKWADEMKQSGYVVE